MPTAAILYSFRRCPYAIRARMALVISGIQVELRELLLKDKPPCMLRYSPKGTVPVLVLNEQQVLDESLEIMHWALEHNDPLQWLTKHNADHQALIDHNDGTFKSWLDRYKYADRHPEQPQAYYQQRVLETLTSLDHRLSDSPFLGGDQAGLVDVALFPFIRQCAFVDKSWFDDSPIPHLQRWLNHWLDSEYFKACMPKFPLFNDGFSQTFPA